MYKSKRANRNGTEDRSNDLLLDVDEERSTNEWSIDKEKNE